MPEQCRTLLYIYKVPKDDSKLFKKLTLYLCYIEIKYILTRHQVETWRTIFPRVLEMQDPVFDPRVSVQRI